MASISGANLNGTLGMKSVVSQTDPFLEVDGVGMSQEEAKERYVAKAKALFAAQRVPYQE
jgi:hypothetical protein